jgi:hypothetical protein
MTARDRGSPARATPARRRFDLLDAMTLVAAIAVWLATVRNLRPKVERLYNIRNIGFLGDIGPISIFAN